MNYEQALTTMILEALGLHDTFYADGSPPRACGCGSRDVASCLVRCTCCRIASWYQPEPCKVSTLAPLIGKDMRMQKPLLGRGGGRHHLEPARS